MKLHKLSFLFILVLVLIMGATTAFALTGTIDPSNLGYKFGKLVTGGAPVNSGKYTTAVSANVTVTDTELTGYMWGESMGWINLNCANNGTCASSNYKVSVNSTACGVAAPLSGYAWGQTAGWVNFGPFVNSSTQRVTINPAGEWNGYAWAQNFGWIEWDCSAAGKAAGKCTVTDWHPPVCPSTTSGGTSGGTGVVLIPTTTSTTGTPITTSSTGTSSTTGTTTSTTGIGTSGTTTSTSGTTSGTTTSSSTGTSSTTGTTTGITTGFNTSGTSGLTTSTTGTTTGFVGGFTGWFPTSTSSSTGTTIVTTTGNTTSLPKPIGNSTGSSGSSTGTFVPPFNTVDPTPIANTVGVVALIVGGLQTFANLVYVNPFSLKDLVTLPFRLWSGFLWIIGIRRKPWGVVYDAKTKRPIDPAYVTLYNENHEELENTFTDMEGRYGFKVKKGTYFVIAKKTHYSFPSILMRGKDRDDVYDALYFGDPIVIKEDNELITQNIPMDPINEDWNEQEKERKGRTRRMLEYVLTKALNLFFWFGFIITAWSAFKTPSPWHLFMLGVYIVLFIISELGLPAKTSMGSVIEKITDTPVSSALIRVYSSHTGVEVSRKVTDEAGKYYALVKEGIYHTTVQKQQPDGTFGPVVHQSNPVEVKKGVLSEKIEI